MGTLTLVAVLLVVVVAYISTIQCTLPPVSDNGIAQIYQDRVEILHNLLAKEKCSHNTVIYKGNDVIKLKEGYKTLRDILITCRKDKFIHSTSKKLKEFLSLKEVETVFKYIIL